MKKLGLIAGLVLIGIFGVSCQTVHVPGNDKNSPGYTLKPYLGACYEVTLNLDVEHVFAATQKGFRKLQIAPTDPKCDKLSGVVAGKLVDGSVVRVELSAVTGSWTRMRLYVGDYANSSKTVMVFDAIKPYL